MTKTISEEEEIITHIPKTTISSVSERLQVRGDDGLPNGTQKAKHRGLTGRKIWILTYLCKALFHLERMLAVVRKHATYSVFSLLGLTLDFYTHYLYSGFHKSNLRA